MKLRKSVIVPTLFLVFAAFGLETLVLPYVPFGSGRWSDSVGTNVSNRSSRINGNLNITGEYYKNGILFTGGGGSDVSFDTVYSRKKDSTKFLTLKDRSTTYIGTNNFNNTTTFDQAYVTGNIVNDGLTQTDTLRVTNGVSVGGAGTIAGQLTLQTKLILQGGVQLTDATKVITNSGSDILYQVTTGGAHIMETQSGTDLMKADSTRGTGTRASGMEALWGGGTLLYQKLIRGLSPTGNATVAYNHGITDGKILDCAIWLRHDTTYTGSFNPNRNWYVAPGSSYDATILYYGGFDSLQVWARFPAAATATRSDSLYFLLTYIQ